MEKATDSASIAPVVRSHKRINFRATLCMPFTVFMVLFVIFPLFLILFYAFTDGETGALTFKNWAIAFTTEGNLQTIGRTFLISFLTTLFCLLIAYPVAYLLANSKYNKNKLLVYIFLLPMWINFVIRTIGVKSLLNGLTNAIFGYDITAEHPVASIVIGMVYDYLPFAILPLYNQMIKMDKNQIEASADLGANPAQVFFKTIIPMTVPGIVSACMMTFMPTMSSYVIANKMSENNTKIIGNIIQTQFITNTAANSNNVGSVLSLLMLMIIGISLIVEKTFKKDEPRKGDLW